MDNKGLLIIPDMNRFTEFVFKIDQSVHRPKTKYNYITSFYLLRSLL